MSVKRGSKTFDILIKEEDKNNASIKYNGRNLDLIEKRNKVLLNRYYVYCVICKFNYSMIIDRLSIEFFISPVTIQKIISNNISKILEIKKKKPTITILKKEYPFYNWDLNSY